MSRGRSARYTVYQPDPDAEYARVIEYDVRSWSRRWPSRTCRPTRKPVSQVGKVKIDQVVIGSCTNGRLEDLQMAASMLKGKKVHPHVRCIVIPGTQQIYLEALREGLVEIFIKAGAVVSTPTCGPCLGGHMGILAAGERCVSTTNRNFVGRMGAPSRRSTWPARRWPPAPCGPDRRAGRGMKLHRSLDSRRDEGSAWEQGAG